MSRKNQDTQTSKLLIGKYGNMALDYMKEHYLPQYNHMSSKGLLLSAMSRINLSAYSMISTMITQQMSKPDNPYEGDTKEAITYRYILLTATEQVVVQELVIKEIVKQKIFNME